MYLLLQHGFHLLLLLVVEGVYVWHCIYQVLIASPSRSFTGSGSFQQQWLTRRRHVDMPYSVQLSGIGGYPCVCCYPNPWLNDNTNWYVCLQGGW